MHLTTGRFQDWRSAAILALVLCLAPQFGCRRADAVPGTVELNIWSGPKGVEEQFFLKICRRFEAEHPGVRIVNSGGVEADKLMRAIVAAAPPDMAYLYGTTPVGPLAANDAIQTLDARFERSGFKETDFLPDAIALGRYQGRLYAMPTTRDSVALYWNRRVFREAGFDPNHPPATTEETLDFAKRLTQRDANGSLKRLGLFLPDSVPVLFAMFGGDLWDGRTGRITANRPENVAALTWLVQLADVQGGYQTVSQFTSGFGSDTSGQNPLATGKLAMRFDGEYAAMHLDRFAPGTDYVLGELPHPAAHPEWKNMAWQDGDVMVIPIGSKHPDVAWEFMRWMQMPAQQAEYAAAMSNLPTIMSLRDSPTFSQGSKNRLALGYVLKHIASNAANSHYFPTLPVTQLYQNALRDAADRALFHESTPQQALDSVQARVEREMRRYAAP